MDEQRVKTREQRVNMDGSRVKNQLDGAHARELSCQQDECSTQNGERTTRNQLEMREMSE